MKKQENLIWQPINLYQPSPHFAILLNRDFAVEMSKTKLDLKSQEDMNRLGAEITSRFKYNEKSPYLFDSNTALVRQININEGVWLVVEGLSGKKPDLSTTIPLRYTNNNMDNYFDTLCLLSLFDMWISYSKVLKEF